VVGWQLECLGIALGIFFCFFCVVDFCSDRERRKVKQLVRAIAVDEGTEVPLDSDEELQMTSPPLDPRKRFGVGGNLVADGTAANLKRQALNRQNRYGLLCTRTSSHVFLLAAHHRPPRAAHVNFWL
jgi:hypothetical protein